MDILTRYGFKKDQLGNYVLGDYDVWISIYEKPYTLTGDKELPSVRFVVRTKRFTYGVRPIADLTDEFVKKLLVRHTHNK